MAGCFGALGGFFTKATFDNSLLQSQCQSLLGIFEHPFEVDPKPIHDLSDICDSQWFNLTLRGIGLTLVITSNLCMWRYFNRALQSSPTSLEASLITTASNLLFSGFLGCFVFGEHLNQTWWLGTAFILVGTCLIASDHKDNCETSNSKSKEQ